MFHSPLVGLIVEVLIKLRFILVDSRTHLLCNDFRCKFKLYLHKFDFECPMWNKPRTSKVRADSEAQNTLRAEYICDFLSNTRSSFEKPLSQSGEGNQGEPKYFCLFKYSKGRYHNFYREFVCLAMSKRKAPWAGPLVITKFIPWWKNMTFSSTLPLFWSISGISSFPSPTGWIFFLKSHLAWPLKVQCPMSTVCKI